MKLWIRSCFFTIIHEYQFTHSCAQFQKCLCDNKLLFNKTCNLINDLWNVIKTKRWLWAKCYKSNLMNFDYVTSSLTESANSSYKRHGSSNIRGMNLDESLEHSISHHDHIEQSREW